MMLRVRRILSAIVFLAIVLGGISLFSEALIPRATSGQIRYASFYDEPKNIYDVMIFGASTLWVGIHPTLLWSEYGIAAFNHASNAEYTITAYFSFMEMLKHQSPKLVILDAFSLVHRLNTFDDDEGSMRLKIDTLPMSMNKIQAAVAIANASDRQSALSYIFPLLRYHDRWKEFNVSSMYTTMFYNDAKYLMGALIDEGVSPFSSMRNPKETEEMFLLDADTTKYYEKIISTCKSKGIEVVVIKAPTSGIWSYARSNAIADFCKEQDVLFADYCLPEVQAAIGLDTQTDFYNETHLNLHGAAKFTSTIGRLLKDNFELPDRRDDASYAFVDEYATLYRLAVQNKMLAQDMEHLLPAGLLSGDSLRLEATDNAYCHVTVSDSLQNGKVYVLAMDDVILQAGTAEYFTVILFDTKERKYLLRGHLPIVSGEPTYYVLTLDDITDTENLSLYLYAGVAGETNGNSLYFENLQFYEYVESL